MTAKRNGDSSSAARGRKTLTESASSSPCDITPSAFAPSPSARTSKSARPAAAGLLERDVVQVDARALPAARASWRSRARRSARSARARSSSAAPLTHFSASLSAFSVAARASTSRACSSQPATWVESSCQAAPRRSSSAVARAASARRCAAAARASSRVPRGDVVGLEADLARELRRGVGGRVEQGLDARGGRRRRARSARGQRLGLLAQRRRPARPRCCAQASSSTSAVPQTGQSSVSRSGSRTASAWRSSAASWVARRASVFAASLWARSATRSAVKASPISSSVGHVQAGEAAQQRGVAAVVRGVREQLGERVEVGLAGASARRRPARRARRRGPAARSGRRAPARPSCAGCRRPAGRRRAAPASSSMSASPSTGVSASYSEDSVSNIVASSA